MSHEFRIPVVIQDVDARAQMGRGLAKLPSPAPRPPPASKSDKVTRLPSTIAALVASTKRARKLLWIPERGWRGEALAARPVVASASAAAAAAAAAGPTKSGDGGDGA
eukprot:8253420-Pyramimonas_sp.AAC.1